MRDMLELVDQYLSDALKASDLSREEWPVVVGIDGTDVGLEAVKNGEMVAARDEQVGIGNNFLIVGIGEKSAHVEIAVLKGKPIDFALLQVAVIPSFCEELISRTFAQKTENTMIGQPQDYRLIIV